VLPAVGLAGCGSSEQEELQQWMTEQRNATKPKVEPLPEPTKFSPQAYNQEGAIEPFSNQKLTQALKRDSTRRRPTRPDRAGTEPAQGAPGGLSAGRDSWSGA
jgi:Tfp pilus assembly protein PilP